MSRTTARNPRSMWYDRVVKPTVYIESSVVSYYAAWPSRDLIVAAHQTLTHQWWRESLPLFEPFTSQLVQEEIGQGDADAAKRRILATADFSVLDVSAEVEELGDHYLAALRFPETAKADAYHLAIAACSGMDYLVSWNCRHIVNARVRRMLQEIDANRGLRSPVVCTPEELTHD